MKKNSSNIVSHFFMERISSTSLLRIFDSTMLIMIHAMMPYAALVAIIRIIFIFLMGSISYHMSMISVSGFAYGGLGSLTLDEEDEDST